ncbi:hypothetical protein ZWY2020_054073 [Hordeum vulgare]|nr:hypothetical protein ZWY2020_054073 [Hordeum vulgare]
MRGATSGSPPASEGRGGARREDALLCSALPLPLPLRGLCVQGEGDEREEGSGERRQWRRGVGRGGEGRHGGQYEGNKAKALGFGGAAVLFGY